ncbi:MAG: type IX secretion system membrane protein PorP/SprF [Muribaculaceae bacterium]
MRTFPIHIEPLRAAVRAVAVMVCLLASRNAAIAQTDAQLTQYWAMPTYYSPGFVGNSDYIRITGASRMQWVGIPKAPRAFLALADSPFKLFGKRVGAGVVVMQESEGLYTSLNAALQAAWKKRIMKGELSVGVQFGLVSQSFKGSDAYIPDDDDYHEGNDDGIPRTDINGTAIDFAAGVVYTHKLFWVSLSATHLSAPTITMKDKSQEEKQYEFEVPRLYYFMAGGNIPVKNTLFEVQPSMMLKTDGTMWTGEGTARLRYNKFISGGFGYRWKDAVSVMIGAEYKNFFLGYSYDYPVSKVAKASSGSHEVFLRYNIKLNMGEKNKNKHKSIRIM